MYKCRRLSESKNQLIDEKKLRQMEIKQGEDAVQWQHKKVHKHS